MFAFLSTVISVNTCKDFVILLMEYLFLIKSIVFLLNGLKAIRLFYFRGKMLGKFLIENKEFFIYLKYLNKNNIDHSLDRSNV